MAGGAEMPSKGIFENEKTGIMRRNLSSAPKGAAKARPRSLFTFS